MSTASPIHKILVPVDFSEPSRVAFDYAVALAATTGATIELFHAYELPPMAGGRLVLSKSGVSQPVADWICERARLDMEKLADTAGADVSISAHLVEGSPAPAIRQRVEEAGIDLIVIATRGRSKIARVLLGSVADRVVRTAPCPVLTVRPESA